MLVTSHVPDGYIRQFINNLILVPRNVRYTAFTMAWNVSIRLEAQIKRAVKCCFSGVQPRIVYLADNFCRQPIRMRYLLLITTTSCINSCAIAIVSTGVVLLKAADDQIPYFQIYPARSHSKHSQLSFSLLPIQQVST